MDARDILRSGDPRAALDTLKQEVRRAPRDARLRIFLFQLFCVFAEWERALNQLGVAAELDPAAQPMAQAYRAAIRCEMLRERVFAGSRTPTIFGDPEPWMPLLIEANRLLATGNPEQAATLRDDAFEQAPAASGSIDGRPFAWIADADQRLGPMLEAFVDGILLGAVPPHACARGRAAGRSARPGWMPAQFTWSNGGESVGIRAGTLSRVGHRRRCATDDGSADRMATTRRLVHRSRTTHAGDRCRRDRADGFAAHGAGRRAGHRLTSWPRRPAANACSRRCSTG